MGYVHLSTPERHMIAVLHRLHYPTRAIVAHRNQHHATIARELRRGMRNNTYIAAYAHDAAIQR